MESKENFAKELVKPVATALILVSTFFLFFVVRDALAGNLPDWGFALMCAVFLTNLALGLVLYQLDS